MRKEGLPRVKISKISATKLEKGYLWVFKKGLKDVPVGLKSGDWVRVYAEGGRFIGTGYYCADSGISIRLVDRNEIVPNERYFQKRIADCLDLRLKAGFALEDTFRVVFGEGDRLPGLVIDKYGDVLCVQIMTAGMDAVRDDIVRSLVDIFSPSCVFEKSDSPTRSYEGLGTEKGVRYGELPDELVVEMDGISFSIDLAEGQKSGMYLDQRFNRRILRRYSKGMRVLDVFSYGGAFSMYALSGGAVEAHAIDISRKALDYAERNASLNGFEGRFRVLKGDAFDELRKMRRRGEEFDAIVVDPPAFSKSRKGVERALKGYKDVNLQAIKLLAPGGLLFSSSCTHYVTRDMLKNAIIEASRDANAELQCLEEGTQPPDHPTLLEMGETSYLKFLVFRKLT